LAAAAPRRLITSNPDLPWFLVLGAVALYYLWVLMSSGGPFWH
jgi:hypothetical protein